MMIRDEDKVPGVQLGVRDPEEEEEMQLLASGGA